MPALKEDYYNVIPVTLTINVPEEFWSPVRNGEDTLVVQV